MRSLVKTAFACFVTALVAAAQPAAAALLYSQLSPISPHHGVPYQDGVGVLLDSEAADDFAVPAGQVWNVDRVVSRGFVLPASSGLPEAVDVAFLLDDGGKPGLPVCEFSAVANVTLEPEESGHTLHIDLPSPCTLCAGTRYWVALQAVDDDGGSYTWRQSPLLAGHPAAWRNPNDGYGTGCTDWAAAAATCGQGDGESPDLAFELYGVAHAPESTVKGDVNGDLCADVVFQVDEETSVKAWYMNGRTRILDADLCPTPAKEWRVVGVDDFNADGLADLVMRHSVSGDVAFKLTGTRCTSPPTPLGGKLPTPGLDWQIEATGDMNRDGQPDLVWRNVSSRKIEVWTLDGTDKDDQDPIPPNPDSAADANWKLRGAVDFSGPDGATDPPVLPDLLWQNTTSSKIVIWFLDEKLNRKSGAFTNPDGPVNTNWTILGVGDYGLGASSGPAGANDFLFQNDDSGKTVIWYMDFARNKITGDFTIPDGPGLDPRWIVVGPR